MQLMHELSSVTKQLPGGVRAFEHSLRNPAWWVTAAAMLGAGIGVFDPGLGATVRATVAGAGSLVASVYVWSHHYLASHQSKS